MASGGDLQRAEFFQKSGRIVVFAELATKPGGRGEEIMRRLIDQ